MSRGCMQPRVGSHRVGGMRTLPVIAVSVALFALSACGSDSAPSGNLDQSAQWACDDLANYMADGAPESSREDALSEVVSNALASEVPAIANAGRNLEGLISLEGWESGADVLATACMNEGWEIS